MFHTKYVGFVEAVVLKEGKERILQQRHHWIFSGAVSQFPSGYQDGTLAPIVSYDKRFLGWGFFNRRCSLVGRVVSFGEEDAYDALKNALHNALASRKDLLNSEKTTAFRLVNGEGDCLPGLIIDKYGPYLVMQTGALGMRKLLPFFCQQLEKNLSIAGIYDKSTGSSLKEEGIAPQEKILWGMVPDQVTILEEGIAFKVAIKKGQKTGFFLDQREMRNLVTQLSKGKHVLNGFCYTGGFTLAALKGGATHVASVDISADALELCKENVLLNGFDLGSNHFYQEDMFDFLSTRLCNYNLVILDPPAFAKKRKDIPSAIKGYKKLFELALRKMPNDSLLLVSSCSYYISQALIEKCMYEVALSTKRAARVLGHHRLAFDHPINVLHPESSYLKSLLIAL